MLKNLFFVSGFLSCLLCSSLSVLAASEGLNLQFKGNLIEDACTVKAGDEDLHVSMRSVSNKDLYDNPRSAATRFTINLEECDPSVASSVKITFTGNESAELDGLLAVSGTGGSKGFAIGIETPAGTLLKLNEVTSVYELALQEGNNTIALQAFLQAETTAITNQSIILGEYSATVTFLLEYL